MGEKCCICDNSTPQWPVTDVTTGFRFCANCFAKARHTQFEWAPNPHTNKSVCDPFANWLIAIATTRNEHQKREVNKMSEELAHEKVAYERNQQRQIRKEPESF